MNKDLFCAMVMLLNAIAIVFLAYALASNPVFLRDDYPDIDHETGLDP